MHGMSATLSMRATQPVHIPALLLARWLQSTDVELKITFQWTCIKAHDHSRLVRNQSMAQKK